MHRGSAPVDTGARLRALYAADGGVRATFTHKVADYIASRPDYPDALFAALAERALLSPVARVADVGAGTGLFSQGLLARGARVVAVEPNPAMRAAAQALLGDAPRFQAVEGSAEEIPLPNACVDLVTAAQAFHWFDIDAARREFLRVLTPSGQVALVWNDRVATDPLHLALDDVFERHGGARRGALLAHEERHDVPRFFNAAPVASMAFDHEHSLDGAGLLSLVFSRSYMPAHDSPAGRAAAVDVDRVFDTFAALEDSPPGTATARRVRVRYRTVAMIGRPIAAPA